MKPDIKPKSMRNVDELLVQYTMGDGNLSADELRLIDLITYHKTGKRTEKFKKAKKKTLPAIPIVSKKTIIAHPQDITKRKDAPYSGDFITREAK